MWNKCSMYIYLSIYIYTHTCIYIHAHTHLHMYICTHIHIYVCVYETTVSSLWTSGNKGQWYLRDEKQCNFQYFPSLLLGERIVHYGEVGFIPRTQVGFTLKNNQCNSLFSDSKGKKNYILDIWRKILNKIKHPFLKNFK